MDTDVTPRPLTEAKPKADEDPRLAVQRHLMDLDGMERFFERYPIDHPEWGSPEVAE